MKRGDDEGRQDERVHIAAELRGYAATWVDNRVASVLRDTADRIEHNKLRPVRKDSA